MRGTGDEKRGSGQGVGARGHFHISSQVCGANRIKKGNGTSSGRERRKRDVRWYIEEEKREGFYRSVNSALADRGLPLVKLIITGLF